MAYRGLVRMKVKLYEDIQKDLRNKRIESILNFKGFNTKQRALINKYNGYLQRKGLRLESKRGYLQNLKLLLLDLNKDIDKITREDIDQYLNKISKQYKLKTVTERRKFLILLMIYLKKQGK